MRRLSCCRKVVLKNDWKTTLNLLHSQAPEVQWSGSLSLPQLFCNRIAFLCFHPFCISVVFTGPFLIVVDFYRNFYPLLQRDRSRGVVAPPTFESWRGGCMPLQFFTCLHTHLNSSPHFSTCFYPSVLCSSFGCLAANS